MFGIFEHDKQLKQDVNGARCLGWASIAIGLTELAATKKVEDMLGISDAPTHRGVLRVLGMRELGHGLSLLTEDRANSKLAASVWSRVAGDVLDTALLAKASTKTRKPGSFAAVSAAVLGIGLLDMYYAQRFARHQIQ